MKRMVLGLVMCAGILVSGVTNASAARYCSLDPTLPLGLPIHTSLNIKTSLLGITTHVYASNTSRSTTFGGVIGLP
jgi:hypothetical protein